MSRFQKCVPLWVLWLAVAFALGCVVIGCFIVAHLYIGTSTRVAGSSNLEEEARLNARMLRRDGIAFDYDLKNVVPIGVVISQDRAMFTHSDTSTLTKVRTLESISIGLGLDQSLSSSGFRFDDQFVEAISNLPNLKDVSFTGTSLTERAFEYISRMEKLESIWVTQPESHLSGDQLNHLSKLENLSFLSLRVKSIDRKKINELCERLPGCTIEVIADNVPESFTTPIGSKHQADPQTTSKAVRNAIKFASELDSLCSDVIIQYDRTKNPDIPIEALIFQCRGSLTKLNPDELANVQTLKSLMISPAIEDCSETTPPYTVDDQYIAALVPLSGLEELHLNDTQISDAVFQHISRFKNLRYLRIHQPQTDFTGRNLAALSQLTRLEFLWITANSINAPEVLSLRKAMPKCRIKVLARNLRRTVNDRDFP